MQLDLIIWVFTCAAFEIGISIRITVHDFQRICVEFVNPLQRNCAMCAEIISGSIEIINSNVQFIYCTGEVGRLGIKQ